MAVKGNVVSSSLKVYFDAGKSNGIQKYNSRVYPGVVKTATDESVHAVGKSLASLSKLAGLKFVRTVNTELVEE